MSDNQFTGSLPNIANLRLLQVLYAENNQLGGQFPDISRMSSLEAINLSNNLAITGALPTTVPSRLKDFRAANCSLTGGVSSGLMRSISLQSLLIEGNQLSGPVPDPSSSIKLLSIANNNFGCVAPTIASGVDASIENNKFLCLPGIERVAGCVVPQVTGLVSVCAGPTLTNCAQATMRLEARDPPAVATITIDSPLPLIGCDDVYCYLGQAIQGKATLVGQQPQMKCTIKPAGVGVFSISLRRFDGVVLSSSGSSPVVVTVTAGCGTKQCSPPNGACTMNGCVCDQTMWSGADCDERVCPRNCLAATKQGVCNTQTGMCMCQSGVENGINFMWSGSDCSVKELTCKRAGPGNQECSGRGQCVRATGKCNCQPAQVSVGNTGRKVTMYYTGDACEFASCPQNGAELCSGHGTCDQRTFDQPCRCSGGASGADCSVGTQTCSGCNSAQSRCNTFNGQCICAPGFKGTRCDEPECPSNQRGRYDENYNYIPGVECSGHGTCMRLNSTSAVCQCMASWDLYASCAAQRIECPKAANGEPCGGRSQGYCVPSTGECKCVSNLKRAYTGPSCDTLACPNAWSNCSPCDFSEQCATDPGVAPSIKGECKFRTVTPPGATDPVTEPYCECMAATATAKGRAGDFCQEFSCVKGTDGTECSVGLGQGTCDRGSGVCICSETGDPLDPKTGCATLLCPQSNSVFDCSGRGKCDPDKGTCTCDDGFGGDGCQETVVNPGIIAGGVIGGLLLLIICTVGVFCCLRQAAIRKLQNH